MVKKPAIPSVPPSSDTARMKFDKSVKERLEIISGERSEKLDPLPMTATLEETCAKLNKLLELLQ